MVERIAVQQEDRRPAAATDGDDAGTRGLDLAALKAVQHGTPHLLPGASLDRPAGAA
jgi:hypothetical protein